MSTSYRRYEILLPRRFNGGQLVPNRLFTETLIQMREKFGATSCETQTIQGQWQHERVVYKDDLCRIFVDVEDTPGNRQFFLSLKGELKSRFQQIDIWLTSRPVDVL
jgi:hypothetical protein